MSLPVKLIQLGVALEATQAETKADADFQQIPCLPVLPNFEQVRQGAEDNTPTGLPSRSDVVKQMVSMEVDCAFYLGAQRRNNGNEGSAVSVPMETLMRAVGATISKTANFSNGDLTGYNFNIANTHETVALLAQDSNDAIEIHSARGSLTIEATGEAVRCKFNIQGVPRTLYGARRTLPAVSNLGPQQPLHITSATLYARNEISGAVDNSTNFLANRAILSFVANLGQQITQLADITASSGVGTPEITQFQTTIQLEVVKGTSLIDDVRGNGTFQLYLLLGNHTNGDTVDLTFNDLQLESSSENDNGGLKTETINLRLVDRGHNGGGSSYFVLGQVTKYSA